MEPQIPANAWEDIPSSPAMPFPVAPADVPEAAVRVVKRTLLRHPDPDPLDDDLARTIVAMVIAVLADVAPEAAGVFAAEYARETGAVVAITAK